MDLAIHACPNGSLVGKGPLYGRAIFASFAKGTIGDSGRWIDDHGATIDKNGVGIHTHIPWEPVTNNVYFTAIPGKDNVHVLGAKPLRGNLDIDVV